MFYKIYATKYNEENEREYDVILYTNIFKMGKDIDKLLKNYRIWNIGHVDFFSMEKRNRKKYFKGSYIEERFSHKQIL